MRFERIRARLSHLVREQVIDLEELARSEYMSLRSLQRLFQLNGTAPGRVILECRLDGVMRDLLSLRHTRTIGEVAFSWGFADQSYFNRQFKRRFGRSPKGVRQP
jgi:AraC family transcriptional activator of tynA and feaB